MTFVVYEHWRTDRGVCFYVGKGSRKRAFNLRRNDSIRHERVVKKLDRDGLKVEVRLVAEGLDERSAFDLEVKVIAERRAQGHPLVNATDGGDGASGAKRTAETRRLISVAKSGKKRRAGPLTPEHRAAISNGLRGRTVSPETRAKISRAQIGKPCPHLVGRKLPPEAIERLRNRVFSEEHKQRISAAKKGKTNSPLHRQRIAEAHARNRLKRQIEGATDDHSHA